MKVFMSRRRVVEVLASVVILLFFVLMIKLEILSPLKAVFAVIWGVLSVALGIAWSKLASGSGKNSDKDQVGKESD